jgi:hypothetical protein
MMPLHMFTSASTAIIFTQNLLFGFVWQSDLYFLPIYYQEVRGYSPVRSAVLLLPLLLLQSVAGVLSGPIMSRLARYRPVLYLGFVLWTIGAGLKVLFSRSTPAGVYVAALLIEGAGVGFVFQPCAYVPIITNPRADIYPPSTCGFAGPLKTRGSRSHHINQEHAASSWLCNRRRSVYCRSIWGYEVKSSYGFATRPPHPSSQWVLECREF